MAFGLKLAADLHLKVGEGRTKKTKSLVEVMDVENDGKAKLFLV